MNWIDEGYLLSKNSFDENSIIIETFTLDHGKCSGIVYGGSSRKQKKNFQIGNKISLNWKSKNENKLGYFNVELINPVSPLFFDDKKRSICILAASSILKLLLPERQINKKIYNLFEEFIVKLKEEDWIKLYILWEISLINELGFEIDLNGKNDFVQSLSEADDNFYNVYSLLKNVNKKKFSNSEVLLGLNFTYNLLMENFIIPNKLKMPLSRKILQKYFGNTSR